MNSQVQKSRRCAMYVRVSTQDQSTEMQVRELNDFINARGWSLVKIFDDKSTGTSTKKRDQLAEMMKLANQRQIDVVIVWKLDRFARSLKDLVTMMSQLNEIGVEFISLKDSIDLTTAHGRLMAQLLGAFAEFEASMIRERVIAGLQNARRKGTTLGRPEMLDRKRILSLRAGGESLRSIANTLGCSTSAVHKIVSFHVSSQRDAVDQHQQLANAQPKAF